jgi:hypothetical protein
MFLKRLGKDLVAMEKDRDYSRAEDQSDKEEKDRILRWLGKHGQTIADGMFRDASLFYDDLLRNEKNQSTVKKS